ncbi:Thrombospondin type-1 domain-containing protein 7A, partial [Trachymyrmex cornetzi]
RRHYSGFIQVMHTCSANGVRQVQSATNTWPIPFSAVYTVAFRCTTSTDCMYIHRVLIASVWTEQYWSTTGSGQQVVTDIPRDNKAAIINSIATSYALQRPRYTATAIPRTSKVVVDGKTRYSETGKSDWPYYQTYRQTAETQKAQIYEDIQRKIANVSDVSSTRVMGYLFANNMTNSVDQRQHRFRMKHHGLTSKGKRIRTRAPRDCKVGEWGPWSACSRSCGVGETQRTRKITIKPRRGGAPCPPLKETKWCGSVNPCSESKPIIDYHW